MFGKSNTIIPHFVLALKFKIVTTFRKINNYLPMLIHYSQNLLGDLNNINLIIININYTIY